jgi:hypothetical protein
MKIRPVGAELFHADGRKDIRTDMKKLISVPRNLAHTHKHATSIDFGVQV